MLARNGDHFDRRTKKYPETAAGRPIDKRHFNATPRHSVRRAAALEKFLKVSPAHFQSVCSPVEIRNEAASRHRRAAVTSARNSAVARSTSTWKKINRRGRAKLGKKICELRGFASLLLCLV